MGDGAAEQMGKQKAVNNYEGAGCDVWPSETTSQCLRTTDKDLNVQQSWIRVWGWSTI